MVDNLYESNKVRLTSRDSLQESTSSADIVGEVPSNDPNSVASELPSCPQYEFISLIGQGGMSHVYKARGKELEREVAIKVIHPQLVSDQPALKRFEQEAKAATDLNHANLVAVYGNGQTDSGAPYLVMDLLDGVSLAEVVAKEGYLDVPRALDIFIQICDALIHAHYKGVIHRDLKPSNVFLTRNEKGVEIVKVIDFGIAKILDKADHSITQTGDVFGSPAYMSPEQCLGSQTDARSDIYSLGCIMYECLTGRLPFAGDNPIQVIVKHINLKPELFGRHSNDLNIPTDLESVVLNTLEKYSEKRYQSMEELRVDLQRLRDGHKPLRKFEVLQKKPEPKKMPNDRLVVMIAMGAAVAAMTWGLLFNIPPQYYGSDGKPLTHKLVPIEIRDVHNKVLYKTDDAKNLSDALEQAIKKGINLSGANLSGSSLSGQFFTQHGANLTGADFSKAHLIGVSFANLDLGKANFRGATFKNGYFDGCILTGADFRDVHVVDPDHVSDLFSINIVNCNLTDADFTNAVLPKLSIGSVATNVKFVNAQLKGAYLEFQNLTGADFAGADLQGAHLRGSMLSGARFRGAKLKGADLRKADIDDCIGADFSGAQLQKE